MLAETIRGILVVTFSVNAYPVTYHLGLPVFRRRVSRPALQDSVPRVRHQLRYRGRAHRQARPPSRLFYQTAQQARLGPRKEPDGRPAFGCGGSGRHGRRSRCGPQPRHQDEGEGMDFIPLAVDTFGGWHKMALETIAKLGRQLARVVGRDESD